jgi:DNA-directed RNA polymerase specialized sigma24 family protein
MNAEMINSIAWIAAEADRPKVTESVGFLRQGQEEHSSGQRFSVNDLPVADLSVAGVPLTAGLTNGQVANLPVHQFPAKSPEQISQPVSADASGVEDEPDVVDALQQTQDVEHAESAQEEAEFRDDDRERRIYRGRTVGMLRRYMRYSIETGRLPSLLGREFFRAKVTSYTVNTFEDRVIFVHDMEICLAKLDEFSRQIIARHILEEHDQAATGRLLGCSERTVRTYVPVVLDTLSEILLEIGLMDRQDSTSKNSCQGGQEGENFVSDCEDGKNKF